MQQTRFGILEYLRERGTGTVEALAQAVGLAPVTVRHHLGVLRARGYVIAETESVGRGRPRYVFSLSPRGAEALIDNGYKTLATRLLGAMKERDDDEPARFFRELAQRLADEHRAEFVGQPIEKRVEMLVRLLGKEGFAARWEQDGHCYVIRQIGCPFHDLGSQHSEVCIMDLELVRSITGGHIARDRWRLSGDDLCEVRIRFPVLGQPPTD